MPVALLLPHTASDQEIHRRWKDLMLIYHPDKKAFPVEYATACTMRLNEAYAVLKDPARRSAYDRDLIKPAVLQSGSGVIRPVHISRADRPAFFSMVRVKAAKMILPVTIVSAVFYLSLLYYENKEKNPAIYQWRGFHAKSAPASAPAKRSRHAENFFIPILPGDLFSGLNLRRFWKWKKG